MKLNFIGDGVFFKRNILVSFMKLFIFFLCSTVFASTSLNSPLLQKGVEIHQTKEYSVKEVFNILKMQTEYIFIYRDDIIKDLPKIKLNKGSITVGELLNKCLPKDSIQFEITDDKSVIIKKVTNVKKLKASTQKNYGGCMSSN